MKVRRMQNESFHGNFSTFHFVKESILSILIQKVHFLNLASADGTMNRFAHSECQRDHMSQLKKLTEDFCPFESNMNSCSPPESRITSCGSPEPGTMGCYTPDTGVATCDFRGLIAIKYTPTGSPECYTASTESPECCTSPPKSDIASWESPRTRTSCNSPKSVMISWAFPKTFIMSWKYLIRFWFYLGIVYFFFGIAHGIFLHNSLFKEAAAQTQSSSDINVIQGLQNFKLTVLRSNHIEVVLFFAHWCNACKVFKGEYVKLYKAKYMTFADMHFSVLDCASENTELVKICRNLSIKGYPTLVAFYPKHLTNHDTTSEITKDKRVMLSNISNVEKYYIIVEESDYLNYRLRDVVYFWRKSNQPRGAIEGNYPLTLSPEVTSNASEFGLLIDSYSGPNAPTRWSEELQAVNPSFKEFDAIHGLMYLLRNWIFTDSTILSLEKERTLLNLLELCRYAFSDTRVKASLTDVILFIYAQGSQKMHINAQNIRILGSKSTRSHHVSRKTRKMPPRSEKMVNEENSRKRLLAFDVWNQFMDGFKMGLYPQLAQGEHPQFRQCNRIYCGIWTLFHFLTVASSYSFEELLKKTSPQNIYYFAKDDSYTLLRLNFLNEDKKEGSSSNSELTENSQYTFNENFPLSGQSSSFRKMNSSRDSVLEIPLVYSTVDIAEIIRDAVVNFLNCLHCRVHFLSVFDNCSYGLCDMVYKYANVPDPRAVEYNSAPGLKLRSFPNNLDKFSLRRWLASNRYPLKGVDRERESFKNLTLAFWRFHNAVTVRTAIEETVNYFKMLAEVLNKNSEKKGNHDRESISTAVDYLNNRSSNFVNYIKVDPRWPNEKCGSCRNCTASTNDQSCGFKITKGHLILELNGFLKESHVDIVYDYNLDEVYKWIHHVYWGDSFNTSSFTHRVVQKVASFFETHNNFLLTVRSVCSLLVGILIFLLYLNFCIFKAACVCSPCYRKVTRRFPNLPFMRNRSMMKYKDYPHLKPKYQSLSNLEI